MTLYHSSKVSVESFVDMAADVAVRQEVDELNEVVTLYFGHDEFILLLGREALARIVEAGSRALTRFAGATAD